MVTSWPWQMAALTTPPRFRPLASNRPIQAVGMPENSTASMAPALASRDSRISPEPANPTNRSRLLAARSMIGVTTSSSSPWCAASSSAAARSAPPMREADWSPGFRQWETKASRSGRPPGAGGAGIASAWSSNCRKRTSPAPASRWSYPESAKLF